MSRVFEGSARFEVVGELGRGANGLVYEVYDRKRGEHVALKTLPNLEPQRMYELKREFRTLADVVHPNLVALHELFYENEQCFFTMELVRGVTFPAWVRIGHAQTFDFNAPTRKAIDASIDHALGTDPEAEKPRCPEVDFSRVREGLGQLVAGLETLHAARKLHRDIKPSNVFVTGRRVVILDFGLAIDVDRLSGRGEIAGTPLYMAPEQASGHALGPPADWYAVGVMLYEALTGRTPYAQHRGSSRIIEAKLAFDPTPPSQVNDKIPQDLDQLCTRLLARNPTHRATSADLAGVLDAAARRRKPLPRLSRLIGRSGELDALARAFEARGSNRPMFASVCGPSGVGKTALVRTFLDGIRERGEALILEGRCFEREMIPYKSFDAVIDALSQALFELDEEKLAELKPREHAALAKIFPVLGHVRWSETSPAGEVADLRELRRRAFDGLYELLSNLAARRRLVISIDDLQWGDADSTALLTHLVSSESPPPIFWVCTHRGAETEKLVAELRAQLAARFGEDAAFREVQLAPLDAEDATNLALALLVPNGAPDPKDTSAARAIALEVGGDPLFVFEMAQYHRTLSADRTDRGANDALSLHELVCARVAALPSAALALLSTVAAAGHPLLLSTATRAAGIESGDYPSLALLLIERLIKKHVSEGSETVEIWHDRIRDAVISTFEQDRLRGIHRRLAGELEISGTADAETLAEHFALAGEAVRAAEYSIAAADHARRALAFDRAAWHFRKALGLLPDHDARRHQLAPLLAESLVNAGRGAEAARVYIDAAKETRDPMVTLELERSAGEQYLISGHIPEGLALLRRVLTAVGLGFPPTALRALTLLLATRAWLSFRGFEFEKREAADIPAETLTRIDTCWAAARGLAMVDTVRGAYFQTRHLALALSAGEPYRVARALAMEVGYRATSGRSTKGDGPRLTELARTLAERVGRPDAIALARTTEGMTAYLRGDWSTGFDLMQQGETIFRTRCTGVSIEVTNATLYLLRCLVYLGKLDEVSARLPTLIKDADERGDLFAATYFRLRYEYVSALADDRPDHARNLVEHAANRWSREGFHLQHYLRIFALAEIDLYVEDGERAWHTIREHWSRIRSAFLLRVQHLRIEALFLRARAALSAAAHGGKKTKSMLRAARSDAAKLSRENVVWAHALAALLRAGVAQELRQPAIAQKELAAAIDHFDRAGMTLHAAAARLSKEPGDQAGEQLDATAKMSRQNIVAPHRWATMLTGRRAAINTSADRR